MKITQKHKIEIEKINQDIYALNRKQLDIDIIKARLGQKKIDIIEGKQDKYVRQYKKRKYII